MCFVELATPQSPIGDGGVCDRTAMFGRRANTWLIITKTDRQNSLPIIPDNSQVGNYREKSESQ
jgi:hypothetical protein